KTTYELKEATAEQVSLEKYVPQLKALKEDTSVPMYQTNVVFLTSDRVDGEINRNIIYSILDKQPKRANVYWFVNVQVTDEPFTQEYSVDMLVTDFIVQVQLYLGFHISQEVNVYLRQIVHDLMKTGRLPKQPQRYS
ncbi:potassium transporter Kup, partial [Lactobacillus johnsonii]|uniref:KUP/HAK/KT family potassium transporter n=1 Tax=Lactobacillus johnsonii TaxID=33959 RepID=UPI001101F697